MRAAWAIMLSLVPASCTSSNQGSRKSNVGFVTAPRGLPTIATAPALEIRVPDSVGGASGQMGRIVRLTSGRFAVADWDGQRILLFDARGGFVRTFGRIGSGPGEFRAPSLIQEVPPDTLLLWDPFVRRITWLDTQSGRTRSLTIGTDKLYGGAPLIGQLNDGRLLVEHEAWTAEHGTTLLQPSITLRLLSQDGGTSAELATNLPVRNQDAQGFRFYGPMTFAATDGARILVGTNTAWAIHVLGVQGDTEATLTRPWHPRSVTETDRAAIRAGAKGMNAPAGFPGDDRFDATIPAFGRILTSLDGTIWVLAFAPPFQYPDSASIFSPQGHFLGTLALPKDFSPTDVGPGYLLGTGRSQDGDWVARLFALNSTARSGPSP